MSSLLEAAFDPPAPPRSAPAVGSGVPGVDIKEWAEKFNDESILFQLIVIGDSTHVWVGTSEASHNSLALSMPAAREGGMPSGTTLLGSHADPGAQRMAQRLTKRKYSFVCVSVDVVGRRHTGVQR